MAKFYAVKIGLKPGIYETWDDCKKQVSGYPGAKYKSFSTKEEAEQFLCLSKKKTDAVQHKPEKKVESVIEIKKEQVILEDKPIIKSKISSSNSLNLTNAQKVAYNDLISGENVFLTGEAGTGKSFVINKFINEMELNNKNILVCAPTGIAAINIGGVTIHRCFQAPIEPQVNKRISKVPKAVMEADVIIIDEISMCRIDLFDYVARVIIKAEENCLKRKQLIVVGDFFQLPPVTVGTDYEVLKKIYPNYDKGFAFESTNWKDFDFKKVVLKNVVRQTDTAFIQQLNKVRVGDKNSIDFFNKNAKKQKDENGIVLCATNKVADDINQEELTKIKSKARIYEATIIGDVKANDKPTFDRIKLKIGARVIVLINDTMNSEFQNGSLGEVVALNDNSVDVLLDHNQNIIRFKAHEWIVENYTLTQENIDGVDRQKILKNRVGSFIQLPLKLAYAITIHKSQGQTYDKVNLIPYSFDCGQLYVALSRVKSLVGLCLINRMRQEDLICNENVRKFYDVVGSEKIARRNKILAQFGNMVITLDTQVQTQFPSELKQLIDNVKKEINAIEKGN